MPTIRDLLSAGQSDQSYPSVTPFADWQAKSKEPDQFKQRLDYADYVRKEYYNKGVTPSPRVTSELRGGMLQNLHDSGFTPEQIEAGFENAKPPEVTDEDRLNRVKDYIRAGSQEDAAIRDYQNTKAVFEQTADPSDDLQARLKDTQAKAYGVATREHDRSLRAQVQAGMIPAAKVRKTGELEEGEDPFEIVVGDKAARMPLGDALAASKQYGVTFDDAIQVAGELSTDFGTVPRYKMQQLHKWAASYQAVIEHDRELMNLLDMGARSLAAEEYTSGKAISRGVSDWVEDVSQDLISVIGGAIGSEEAAAVAAAEDKAEALYGSLSPNQLAEVAQKLMVKRGYIAQDEVLPNEDVAKAFGQLADGQASGSGYYQFFDDIEEIGKNIRFNGYSTPSVPTAMLADKDMLEVGLAQRTDIPEELKTQIREYADHQLAAQFPETDDLLINSDMAEQWLNFRTQRQQAGIPNHQILSEFVRTGEYSKMQQSMKGIGWSVVDAFGSAAAALPAVAGADWAKNYLVENAERRANHRRLANTFGQDFGIGQEVGELIFPVLVDVGATALLSSVSGGTVGGLYLSGKAGSRLTATGMAKAFTSRAFMVPLGKEAAENAVERMVARKLVQKSVAAPGEVPLSEVFRSYTKLIQSPKMNTVAAAIPAANRSMAGTYGSVYSELQHDESLTDAERHNISLGAALFSGGVTGLITGIFSYAGAGGIEDALVRGASHRTLKEAINNAAGRKIGDEAFDTALTKVTRKALDQFTKTQAGIEMLKDMGQEASEEFLDEFSQSFVQDAALNENTPMMDRLSQSFHAGLLGGIMGAGVPLVRGAGDAIARAGGMDSALVREQSAIRKQGDLIVEGVVKQLESSGSPATAQVVRQIMQADQGSLDRVRLAAETVRGNAVETRRLDAQSQEEQAIAKNFYKKNKVARDLTRAGLTPKLDIVPRNSDGSLNEYYIRNLKTLDNKQLAIILAFRDPELYGESFKGMELGVQEVIEALGLSSSDKLELISSYTLAVARLKEVAKGDRSAEVDILADTKRQLFLMEKIDEDSAEGQAVSDAIDQAAEELVGGTPEEIKAKLQDIVRGMRQEVDTAMSTEEKTKLEARLMEIEEELPEAIAAEAEALDNAPDPTVREAVTHKRDLAKRQSDLSDIERNVVSSPERKRLMELKREQEEITARLDEVAKEDDVNTATAVIEEMNAKWDRRNEEARRVANKLDNPFAWLLNPEPRDLEDAADFLNLTPDSGFRVDKERLRGLMGSWVRNAKTGEVGRVSDIDASVFTTDFDEYVPKETTDTEHRKIIDELIVIVGLHPKSPEDKPARDSLTRRATDILESRNRIIRQIRELHSADKGSGVHPFDVPAVQKLVAKAEAEDLVARRAEAKKRSIEFMTSFLWLDPDKKPADTDIAALGPIVKSRVQPIYDRIEEGTVVGDTGIVSGIGTESFEENTEQNQIFIASIKRLAEQVAEHPADIPAFIYLASGGDPELAPSAVINNSAPLRELRDMMAAQRKVAKKDKTDKTPVYEPLDYGQFYEQWLKNTDLRAINNVVTGAFIPDLTSVAHSTKSYANKNVTKKNPFERISKKFFYWDGDKGARPDLAEAVGSRVFLRNADGKGGKIVEVLEAEWGEDTKKIQEWADQKRLSSESEEGQNAYNRDRGFYISKFVVRPVSGAKNRKAIDVSQSMEDILTEDPFRPAARVDYSEAEEANREAFDKENPQLSQEQKPSDPLRYSRTKELVDKTLWQIEQGIEKHDPDLDELVAKARANSKDNLDLAFLFDELIDPSSTVQRVERAIDGGASAVPMTIDFLRPGGRYDKRRSTVDLKDLQVIGGSLRRVAANLVDITENNNIVPEATTEVPKEWMFGSPLLSDSIADADIPALADLIFLNEEAAAETKPVFTVPNVKRKVRLLGQVEGAAEPTFEVEIPGYIKPGKAGKKTKMPAVKAQYLAREITAPDGKPLVAYKPTLQGPSGRPVIVRSAQINKDTGGWEVTVDEVLYNPLADSPDYVPLSATKERKTYPAHKVTTDKGNPLMNPTSTRVGRQLHNNPNGSEEDTIAGIKLLALHKDALRSEDGFSSVAHDHSLLPETITTHVFSDMLEDMKGRFNTPGTPESRHSKRGELVAGLGFGFDYEEPRFVFDPEALQSTIKQLEVIQYAEQTRFLEVLAASVELDGSDGIALPSDIFRLEGPARDAVSRLLETGFPVAAVNKGGQDYGIRGILEAIGESATSTNVKGMKEQLARTLYNLFPPSNDVRAVEHKPSGKDGPNYGDVNNRATWDYKHKAKTPIRIWNAKAKDFARDKNGSYVLARPEAFGYKKANGQRVVIFDNDPVAMTAFAMDGDVEIRIPRAIAGVDPVRAQYILLGMEQARKKLFNRAAKIRKRLEEAEGDPDANMSAIVADLKDITIQHRRQRKAIEEKEQYFEEATAANRKFMATLNPAFMLSDSGTSVIGIRSPRPDGKPGMVRVDTMNGSDVELDVEPSAKTTQKKAQAVAILGQNLDERIFAPKAKSQIVLANGDIVPAVQRDGLTVGEALSNMSDFLSGVLFRDDITHDEAPSKSVEEMMDSEEYERIRNTLEQVDNIDLWVPTTETLEEDPDEIENLQDQYTETFDSVGQAEDFDGEGAGKDPFDSLPELYKSDIIPSYAPDAEAAEDAPKITPTIALSNVAYGTQKLEELTERYRSRLSELEEDNVKRAAKVEDKLSKHIDASAKGDEEAKAEKTAELIAEYKEVVDAGMARIEEFDKTEGSAMRKEMQARVNRTNHYVQELSNRNIPPSLKLSSPDQYNAVLRTMIDEFGKSPFNVAKKDLERAGIGPQAIADTLEKRERIAVERAHEDMVSQLRQIAKEEKATEERAEKTKDTGAATKQFRKLSRMLRPSSGANLTQVYEDEANHAFLNEFAFVLIGHELRDGIIATTRLKGSRDSKAFTLSSNKAAFEAIWELGARAGMAGVPSPQQASATMGEGDYGRGPKGSGVAKKRISEKATIRRQNPNIALREAGPTGEWMVELGKRISMGASGFTTSADAKGMETFFDKLDQAIKSRSQDHKALQAAVTKAKYEDEQAGKKVASPATKRAKAKLQTFEKQYTHTVRDLQQSADENKGLRKKTITDYLTKGERMNARKKLAAFIEAGILNNKELAEPVDPNRIARRVADRFAQQQRDHDTHAKNAILSSMPTDQLEMIEGFDQRDRALTRSELDAKDEAAEMMTDLIENKPVWLGAPDDKHSSGVGLDRATMDAIIYEPLKGIASVLEQEPGAREAFIDLYLRGNYGNHAGSRSAMLEAVHLRNEDLVMGVAHLLGTGRWGHDYRFQADLIHDRERPVNRNDLALSDILVFERKLEAGRYESGVKLREHLDYLFALMDFNFNLKANPNKPGHAKMLAVLAKVKQHVKDTQDWMPDNDQARKILVTSSHHMRQVLNTYSVTRTAEAKREEFIKNMVFLFGASPDTIETQLEAGRTPEDILSEYNPEGDGINLRLKLSDDVVMNDGEWSAAMILMSALNTPDSPIVINATTFDVNASPGFFDPNTGVVTMNLSEGNGRGIINAFLEEELHRVFFDTVDNPTTVGETMAVQRLEGIRKQLLDSNADLSPQVRAQLEQNTHEFLAAVLLNPEVQEELSQIPSDSQDKRSWWRRLLDVFTSLFNPQPERANALSDALDSVLTITHNVDNKRLNVAKIVSAASERALHNLKESHNVAADIKKAEQVTHSKAGEQTFINPLERAVARPKDALAVATPQSNDVLDGLGLTQEEFDTKAIDIASLLRSATPMSMDFDLAKEANAPAMSRRGRLIDINMAKLMARTKGMSKREYRDKVLLILKEEQAHVASFTGLPRADLDNVIASMSTSDMEEEANTYYKDTPDKLSAAVETLNDKSEENAVANYNMRVRLAEEMLARKLVAIVEGKASVDEALLDVGKPSRLTLMTKYLGRVFTNLVKQKHYSFESGGSATDQALTKIYRELRALHRGYRDAMFGDENVAEFNPDNPVATDYLLGVYFNGDPEREALRAEAYAELEKPDFNRSTWNLPVNFRGVATGAVEGEEEEMVEEEEPVVETKAQRKAAEKRAKKEAKIRKEAQAKGEEDKKEALAGLDAKIAEKDAKIAEKEAGIAKDTKAIEAARKKDPAAKVGQYLHYTKQRKGAIAKITAEREALIAERVEVESREFDVIRRGEAQLEADQKNLAADKEALLIAGARVNVDPLGSRHYNDAKAKVAAAEQAVTDRRKEIAKMLDLEVMGEETLGTSEGAGADTSGFNMDFAYLEKYMEVPLLKMDPLNGEWTAPKSYVGKVLKGDADPRLYRLLEQREAAARTGRNVAQDWRNRFNKAIKDTWSDGNVDNTLLNRAFGSSRARSGGRATLTTEQVDVLNREFAQERRKLNLKKGLTKAQLELELAALKERTKQKREDLMKKTYLDLRDDRSAALRELAVLNPELSALITDARTKFIDQMAKSMENLYDVKGGKPGKDGKPIEKIQLAAHADKNGGIYLTRQMEVHRDPDIISKIKKGDIEYVARYEKAVEFVRQRAIKAIALDLFASGNVSDMAEATTLAASQVEAASDSSGQDFAKRTVDGILHGYKRRSQESAFQMLRNTDKGYGGQLSESDKLLENKTDMAETIQELLGEYTVGKQAQPVDAFVGTMSMMFSAIAQQKFLHNLKEVGVGAGWLVDAETKRAADATDINKAEDDDDRKRRVATKQKYHKWQKVKSQDAGDFWDHNPLNDMYMPPEANEQLRNALQDVSVTHDSSEASKVVTAVHKGILKLTGVSMGAKTLGSVGFFMRNVVSNALFFGVGQGSGAGFNIKALGSEASAAVMGAMGKASLTDYRAKLMSLGVLTESLHSDMFERLVRGDLEGTDLVTMSMDAAAKAAKGDNKAIATLRALSSAVDGYYKTAYFEAELKVLQKAQRNGTGIHEESGKAWKDLTPIELEFMAADIVKATAQSIDRAPQLVRKMQGSMLTAAIAPFFRFTSEVPRIAVNTVKQWSKESKSDNPVIKARSRGRLAGMIYTLTVSAAVPMVSAMAAGVSDEEDQALRKSMPIYLRGNSFIYIKGKDGKPSMTWDFTYINPFAMLIDPFIRSFNDLVNGREDKFIGSFLTGMIGNTYLDNQILADAVIDVQRNVNQTFDEPIWEATDSTAEKVLKGGAHILHSAYTPKQVEGALQAMRSTVSDGADSEPMSLFFKSWWPTKPHKLDYDRQLRRYLYDIKEQYTRAGKHKNKLLSQRGITANEARKAYRDEVAGKMAVNKDIYDVAIRGFGGFMSDREIAAAMKSVGMGKSRITNLFNRVMDRPVYSPDYIRQLRADPIQSRRLDHALAEQQSSGRLIPLDD